MIGHEEQKVNDTSKMLPFECDSSYDRHVYCISTLYLSCAALLQIPADLNQTGGQILHNHSAPCA